MRGNQRDRLAPLIMSVRGSFWTRQPGIALYTTFFIFSILVRLPWLLLSYAVPSLRPDRTWTYRQALTRTLVRHLLDYLATVELKPGVNLEPGKEKESFVIIQPAKEHLYRDILLCDRTIKPSPIGAVWFPKPPDTHKSQRRQGSRVFLHLHGGAYVISSVRDPDIKAACALLLQASPGSFVFCPEYRLASHPGGRFPAPFQDAVTAYTYLVSELQIPAADIVISGDSAGAHLALGLLRYINAHQDVFPEPGAVLLWSPWPDMKLRVEDAVHRPAVGVDFVAPSLIAWAYRDFLPDPATGIQRDDPYLTPNGSAIPTRVPIWIQWGGAEVLGEDIEKLAKVQREVEGGGKVEIFEVPHAPHNIFVTAPVLGWVKEAGAAVKDAIRFLDETK